MKLKSLFNYFASRLMMAIGLAISCFVCADETLDKYLPQSCYQTGQFEQQKPLGKTNKMITTNGRYAFACDKGLVWHTQSPLTETTVYQLNGHQWIKSDDQPMQLLTGKIHQHLGKILNQLIGGNQDYLRKNFVVSETDNLLQLTPRQSRMKKFLLGIEIARNEQGVNIKLQHPKDNFTSVRIVNIQNMTSLSELDCRESTQTGVDVCHTLLAPDS